MDGHILTFSGYYSGYSFFFFFILFFLLSRIFNVLLLLPWIGFLYVQKTDW